MSAIKAWTTMREKTNRHTEMIFLIVVNGSSPMVEIELDAAEKGLKAGRGCQKCRQKKVRIGVVESVE